MQNINNKLKVNYFNRDPRPGNYTFEQLFDCIRELLQSEIVIENNNLPSGINALQAILWARKRNGNINHITGDVNFLSYGLTSERTILTVHDLGHYTITLKGWKKYLYKKLWLEGPFHRVKKLTAISEFTKQQLVQVLGISEEKIEMIPNPLLPGINFSKKGQLNERPVILQIGSGKNKNLNRLIEAVKGLDVKLLLINKLYDPLIREKLKEYNIMFEQRADLDFHGLKQAYIDCDLLFFASEYEGFGMPIIEAQATGRPVITSNITSMPEVAGEVGALLVDPFSIKEIREAIIKMLTSSSIRENLIEKGNENSKKYDASLIAKQYLKLYKKI